MYTHNKAVSAVGAHVLRGGGDDDQCPDRPDGPGAPAGEVHGSTQPGVGQHHQSGHTGNYSSLFTCLTTQCCQWVFIGTNYVVAPVFCVV